MASIRLSRRQFLKAAGAATGVLILPGLFGYSLLREAEGELLPTQSPYAASEELEGWPQHEAAACPVLLLANEHSPNSFGAYLAEILRAEGLNCFQVGQVSDLHDAPLDWYDIVILPEGPLDNSQIEQLAGYVAKGGRLIATRPAEVLASVFGLERLGGNTSEGYLQVEGGHPIAQGIAQETLQFHGVADHYRLVGAQAIAWLADGANTRTSCPALTLHAYGQGQAAAWAFDLARSIAYTRQGNPAWANQERDGFNYIRATDMFKGWVDLDRLAIPQADEQQRLLANLLTALSREARPLPRLWYFPGAADAMLIATADSHENPASAIEDVLSRAERRGGHMSVYYSPPLQSDLSRAGRLVRFWATDLPVVGEQLARRFPSPTSGQVAAWRRRGHEFALHPYIDLNPREPAGLDAGWQCYWKEFTGAGLGPVPPTVRTHAVVWSGWVETARYQAARGMRLNMDYYHVGPAFRKDNGEWVYGHFTGSGLPMKFVDEQGRILNIFQQLTQLADDHLVNLHWGGQVKLRADEAVEIAKTMLRRSQTIDHCAITAQFHVDPYAAGENWRAEAARWLEGVMDFAQAQNIPIWSALEWLRFAETRHDANFEDMVWQPEARRLDFRLNAQATPGVELAVMLPLQHGQATLAQVEVDNQVAPYHRRQVGGVEYGWVSVKAGPHQVIATWA